MSIIIPDHKLYKIINSVNIINQQGLFFYNNHPWYPLEHTYEEHSDFTTKKLGREKFDKLMMMDTVAGCFNIHKSLVPAIMKRLADLGITKIYIYPDMNNFKSVVTEQGIYNRLTLKK